MRKILVALFMSLSVFLFGCAGGQVEDFQGTEPRLVLADYFNGESRGYGIFEDRFGKLRREFVVDVTGTVDGDVLTLDERFVYKDGETDRRIWTIRKLDDHTYEGTSPDIDGVATGKAYGNALTWAYDIDLVIDPETVWRVRFTDWFYLQPDGVLLNRASVTRFGIEIGTLTLVFLKK